MKCITFHPDADAELTEAVRYYELRQPGLGVDLLSEVESALNQILDSPEACQKITNRIRRKLLWRFPYDLLYSVNPEKIQIVAFAHQKRRPYYWRKRIKEAPVK